jgi:hypothetical protein
MDKSGKFRGNFLAVMAADDEHIRRWIPLDGIR